MGKAYDPKGRAGALLDNLEDNTLINYFEGLNENTQAALGIEWYENDVRFPLDSLSELMDATDKFIREHKTNSFNSKFNRLLNAE